MRNPLGFKALRTYQQGEEIYELTRKFTAVYLDPIKDSRLIGHMNDSGRSVPRNIAEGYNWNNTKKYYDFLGFSFGSLVELLEDYLELEKDIKGWQRISKDNNGALRMISQAIKLCMGEKTMLKNQMEKIEQMIGEQGLMSQNQRIAKNMAEDARRNKIFDEWLEDVKRGVDRPLKF